MFLNWLLHRKTIEETFKQVARLLPLKNFKLNRYPTPALAGDYFGFSIVVEGAKKKMGFRFLVVIRLPQPFGGRVFLAHESRKTSLKPVASLKLVTTLSARFNQEFLLLADDEAKTKTVFQPYLCGKIVALVLKDWQLDVSGEEAHLELWQSTLNASHLCEVLKILSECLNTLMIAELS